MYKDEHEMLCPPVSVKCMETIDKLKSKPGGHYSQNLSIYNYTTKPITIVNRMGIVTIIKPQHLEGTHKRGPGIMVTVELRGARSHVTLDATCILNGEGDATNATLRENYHTGGMGSADYTTVNYWLPLSYLDEHEGVAYLPQVDVQVSTLSEDVIPPHPHTADGRGYHNTLDNEFFKSNGHSAMAIELIDNENKIGTRYINFLQTVYKLVRKRDTTRTSGIYITTNGHCNAQGNKEGSQHRRISFEDVREQLGVLYSTYVEAAAMATVEQNEEHSRKEELKDLERREYEFKIAKQKHEETVLEHKRQLDLESRKVNESKFAQDRVKELFDEERARKDERRTEGSHKRKLIMEYAKVSTSLLAIGIAIWAKFKK